MSTFSGLLKQAMSERNINQAELSALTGIGKSSISQYLSGKNKPNMKAMNTLVAALDVSINYFEGKTTSPDYTDDLQGIKNVSVKQAAILLGKSEQFVRISIQRGIVPFGFAVKMTGDKYSYYISLKKLYEYTGTTGSI